MSPPAFSRGPSILFVTHILLPSVPASGVSKTQAFFPGCCSPHPGPHPPGLLPHLLLWLGVFCGARSCRGVPMLYLREPLCASCHGPRPRTWHLPVSTQHLSVFHRKNLLELSSQAWCGGGCQIPPRARGPLGTHQNPHVCRAHGKVGQRPQLGHQAASPSWPGPSKEVQLPPRENDGYEQLPSWPGASPPDVPESSRCLGTLVEVDAAESSQLPG